MEGAKADAGSTAHCPIMIGRRGASWVIHKVGYVIVEVYLSRPFG